MDFLDGLLGALQSIGDAIAQIFVYLFYLIVQVFQFLWAVITIVGQYLLQGVKIIGSLFSHLWSNFFKGIFTKLFDAIGKLHTWLETHLRPIINFIKRIRKFVDQWYRAYLRPFLSMLQHIRRFLQVLRLLHIHIFDKLDKLLAQVQADVLRSFQQVRGILNTVIDLLNIVADPTMLIRRPTLVLSMRRTIHALIRQITGLPPGYFFPSPHKNAPHGLGFLSSTFNPADPNQNPPASYYLTLDSGVPSFDFLGPGDTIPDTAVDGVAPLDYFDGSLYPDPTCIDPVECLRQAAQTGLMVQ